VGVREGRVTPGLETVDRKMRNPRGSDPLLILTTRPWLDKRGWRIFGWQASFSVCRGVRLEEPALKGRRDGTGRIEIGQKGVTRRRSRT
jgi:hypothetical protein